MGNYELLKAAINEVIKANGRQEITGEVLNQVLLSMVNSLGAGYQCMGVATPSTNPGTPDQNVFYFATQAGTYTNFDAIVLQAGISVLIWDGDWASQTWFTIDATPTNNSQNLIASGAVFNALKLDGGAYDVSAHNSGATFASLSALLNSANLDTLIPTEIRHGGMSIKFVQSSDNKYVQYFLTKSIWSSTQSDWEKMNLEEEISQLGQEVDNYKTDAEIVGNIFSKDTMADVAPGFFVGVDGSLGQDPNCAVSSRFEIKADTNYWYHNLPSDAYIVLFDENGDVVSPLNPSGGSYGINSVYPGTAFKTPATAKYAIVTTTFLSVSYKDDISIYEGTEEKGYVPFAKELLYSQLPSRLFIELDNKADLEDVVVSRNLFDKSKIEQGWIGTGAGGGDVVHGDGPGYQVSPLISVVPNTIYYITYADGLTSKAFRFVDADGNPLKALSENGTELPWSLGQSMAVKSPSTAKYAQFQVLFNYNGDADQTQFEIGSVPTPHQDYENAKLLPEGELPLSVQELIHRGIKHKLILNLSAGVLSSVISPFNSTHDLKMTFYVNQHNRNRLFNWEGYYLVNKSTGVETLAKWSDDDTCPELLAGGMGYIGANHGAYGFTTCICEGHDKSVADIGSVWSNGTHNFTIIGVEPGKIYLIGNNTAIYPDWYFNTPGGTDTFTHVSGATHTASFTITSHSIDQWMPICYTRARKVYLDGEEILESGEYTFDEMQIVETYDVLNPASVLEKIQSGVGSFSQNPLPTDFAGVADSVMEHSITYTFKGANQNMIATSVTYMQPVSFDHFGFTQCIELPSANGLKLYIPKAKSKNNGQDAVDFRTIVDASMGTGYIEGNDFENPNLPPDRELQFNPEIGVMIGYLFDYGVGGNNRKDALVNHVAIYQSNGGMKMYPFGISGNTLTQYDTFSAVCFKSFLDRSGINTGGVIAKNVFEYNNRCYIFSDFNASGIYEIMIPEKYIGHKVNIFEMRENVRLLNEIATDRIRIRVNSAAVMYGYFVAYID